MFVLSVWRGRYVTNANAYEYICNYVFVCVWSQCARIVGISLLDTKQGYSTGDNTSALDMCLSLVVCMFTCVLHAWMPMTCTWIHLCLASCVLISYIYVTLNVPSCKYVLTSLVREVRSDVKYLNTIYYYFPRLP